MQRASGRIAALAVIMLASTGGWARAQVKGAFTITGVIAAAASGQPKPAASPQCPVAVMDSLHPGPNPPLTLTLTAIDLQTPGKIQWTGGNGAAGAKTAYFTLSHSFPAGPPTMPSNYIISIDYEYTMTIYDYAFTLTPNNPPANPKTSLITYTGTLSGNLMFSPPIGGSVPGNGVVKLVVGQVSGPIDPTTVVLGIMHRTTFTVGLSNFYSTMPPGVDINYVTTSPSCEIRALVTSNSQ
jgi:hypothetical protein